MKAFAVALLVVVTACGQGHAIFNVDVYSFMQGTGRDTIPYIIPPDTIPPVTPTTVSTVQKINLPPGFGSSVVDSVRITTGSANLENTGGSGTIGFQLFFASDSAGTYTAPMALNIPATSVTGTQTVPVVITGDISGVVDSLFRQETVYMRIAVTVTNAGATPVTGEGVMTALIIRVVLQDKVF
jgi:hypothetical protein